MNLEGGDSRRHHPFGRWANLLVLAGTSLSILQSVVVALGAVALPFNEGGELTGLPLGGWLLAGVGLPGLVGWTALRAVRAWWRRSVTVIGPLVLASVLAAPSTWLLSIPLGDELLTPIGYLPASLLMLAGAVMARPRIVEAQREGRGGLGS